MDLEAATDGADGGVNTERRESGVSLDLNASALLREYFGEGVPSDSKVLSKIPSTKTIKSAVSYVSEGTVLPMNKVASTKSIQSTGSHAPGTAAPISKVASNKSMMSSGSHAPETALPITVADSSKSTTSSGPPAADSALPTGKVASSKSTKSSGPYAPDTALPINKVASTKSVKGLGSHAPVIALPAVPEDSEHVKGGSPTAASASGTVPSPEAASAHVAFASDDGGSMKDTVAGL